MKHAIPSRRSLTALALVALTLVASVMPAMAARNKATVSVADTTFGVSTMAYVGDSTAKSSTAKASTLDGGPSYWVHAICSQDGAKVFEQYADASNGSGEINPGTTTLWSGGDADCTADLLEWKRNRFSKLASDSFLVKG